MSVQFRQVCSAVQLVDRVEYGSVRLKPCSRGLGLGADRDLPTAVQQNLVNT
jgi:hypothetical protein